MFFAATAMANTDEDPIPFDVTRDILSRLPVKTIVRFRMACKLWETTICDPRFEFSHVPRKLFSVCNRLNPSLTFLSSPPNSDEEEDSFPLEFLGRLNLPEDYCFNYLQSFASRYGSGIDPELQPIYAPLVDCVHGLVIVETHDKVVIHNPTIRESKILPAAETPFAYGKTVLHYDPVSGDYICLRFQRTRDRKFEGIIIGLNDSEWTVLPRPSKHLMPPWISGFTPTTAYLNGCLYLASHDGQIVRFHPSTKAFEKVLPPSGIDSKVSMRVLFVYQGKLAMTSHLMRRRFDRVLFTLEDEIGKVWTRVEFVVEDRAAVKECEKRAITDDGEIVLVNRYLRTRNNISYYNPLNGDMRVVVAEVVGLAEDDFETHFGDRSPRALLHLGYVEHLMFLK